ncbi:MAG TPA: protein kinase [Polyangiaceae bacterium]|nr:protein kinase [Polyangiaceae bacterium]
MADQSMHDAVPRVSSAPSTANAPPVASAPAENPPLWKGTSRYEVLSCLGRGGMGIVYEAFDRQRHERIALKMLLHSDPVGLYQFKKEFRTLADVLHPNLVHLHELVAGEGEEVFFAMELVEGRDFLGHVQKAGRKHVSQRTGVLTIDTVGRRVRKTTPAMPAGVLVEVETAPRTPSPADFEKLRPALRQLVDGVRALHGAGILHRDLKPSNVRVTAEGRVVILDFGVATELKKGARSGGEEEVVGTVTYMAPEQASGEEPAAASDWYSVGALLYEAIVGYPPFGGSAIDVLTLKYTVAPTAPSSCVLGVPEDLNALCMALLAPDPESRPTAAEILRRLGETPSDQAPAATVSDGPEAMSLVGREAPLRDLHDAFEATREGRAVAVRVSGLSGLGKSVMVHHFLDKLERRSDVLILRGRAYSRESMPFKAVDSIVDVLSRHLMDLQARGEPLELPRNIGALAHVFPVLRRVPGIAELPQSTAGDPQVVRQLAFGALRDVFAALSKLQSVVLFVDDVQWGDTDSAALLVELMRPPSAPPVLLLTTHRSEEEDTSAFLADIRTRWPEEAEARELAVGPLTLEESRTLALSLLGSEDATAQETADGIAQESGGSPFLLEELARAASAYHRIAMGDTLLARPAVSLDQMLAARIARLPDDARRLLEVIAVGGRPLPVATVGAATAAGDSVTQLVAALRTRRFVRAALREGVEIVEASHDRIRETIVAQLPVEVAREAHRKLARVLEATPDADPEAIASHLLGAGDRERAAVYAERAAEQAVTKLAFAQAARLFELTLETVGPSSTEARRLARRAAEACEWAGHAEKAARAYLRAAEGAPALERVDLERLAAAQLIAAGRIDESAEVSRRVLTAVGRKVPDSVLATIFGVIVYRVLSALLLRKKQEAALALTPEDEVRLEALHAIGRGLAVVDPVSATYVKTRHLVDALRSGNRQHIVRAAFAEASSLASNGGPVRKRERTLFDLARSLLADGRDPAGQALYQVTYGICLYLRGEWKASHELLDEACARLEAARRWQANANVYAVYAIGNTGNLREVKLRTTRLLADAGRRGDLYTAVNLRASHPMGAWLAADDVETARRHIRESMAQWSKTRFLVQHWQSMLWESEVDLYEGEGSRAWDRLARDARALRRSRLLSVQLIRALTHFVRGRSAVASLGTLGQAQRAARLAEAAREQRALVKDAMPWTDVLASILAACVASASGDGAAAERALRESIDRAEGRAMALHAAAARHRLGTLLGGEAGAAMVHDAAEAMKTMGVRAPERYAGMLLPGPWS